MAFDTSTYWKFFNIIYVNYVGIAYFSILPKTKNAARRLRFDSNVNELKLFG
ncbi:hypothetical protein THOD04_20144 [Vibrio owensii]|nr:hypothetical protein THOD04_20144 [Vibrio owensii]